MSICNHREGDTDTEQVRLLWAAFRRRISTLEIETQLKELISEQRSGRHMLNQS